MTYSAEMILHSVHPDGEHAVKTWKLRYPRFIHAEELTHRVLSSYPEIVEVTVPDGVMYDSSLSRNASSSRAVPTTRLLEDIERDPVEPLFWGKNQPGMRAKEELTGDELRQAKVIWDRARSQAIESARDMAFIGAHKQIVNRIVEPYSHINVIVTGTSFKNFLWLRQHEDAQPEIKALADAVAEAINNSTTPQELKIGEWHLPWVTTDEINVFGGLTDPSGVLRKLSAARSARVSYMTHDMKQPSVLEDVKLFNLLVGGDRLHASPTEHQASPDGYSWMPSSGAPWNTPLIKVWDQPELHGNLTGFIQARKLLDGEFVSG